MAGGRGSGLGARGGDRGGRGRSGGMGPRGGRVRAGGALDAPFFLAFETNGEEAKKDLEHVAEAIEEVGHSAEEAASHTEHLGHSFGGFIHSIEAIEHAGHTLHSVGHSMVGTVEQLSHSVFHTAAEFDQLEASFSFAFRDGTQEAFARLQQFEQQSSYPMSQLVESVAALRSAFHEIDPTRLEREFATGTGNMISGLEALSDAAAGAQVGLGDTIRMVEGALEGQFDSLQYQMRLSAQEVTRMRAEIGRATNDQEKYNAIVRTLAQHWGGAQQAVGRTFNMATLRLHSMSEQLLAAFGKDGLAAITPVLFELHDFMVHMKEDEDFMKAVSSAFTALGHAIAYVIKEAIHLGHWMVSLVKAYPNLVKYTMMFLAVGGALAIALGTLLTVLASVAAAIVAIQAAAGMVVPVLTAVGTVLGHIILAAAAIGLVAYGVKRAFETNLGGIQTFFRGLFALVRGVTEAVSNWGEESTWVTEETYRAMERYGVDKYYRNIVGWIARAQRAWHGFYYTLRSIWSEIEPQLVWGWNEIKSAISQVWTELQRVFAADGFFQSVRTSLLGAEQRGVALGEVLRSVIVPAVKYLVAGIRMFALIAKEVLIPAFAAFGMLARDIVGWLVENWTEVSTVLRFILKGALVPMIGQLLIMLAVMRLIPPVARALWAVLRGVYFAFVRPLVNAFRDLVSLGEVMAGLVDTWRNEGVMAAFRTLANLIEGMIGRMLDGIREAVVTVANFLHQPVPMSMQRRGATIYAGGPANNVLSQQVVTVPTSSATASDTGVPIGEGESRRPHRDHAMEEQTAVLRGIREELRRNRPQAPSGGGVMLGNDAVARAVNASEQERQARLGHTNPANRR